MSSLEMPAPTIDQNEYKPIPIDSQEVIENIINNTFDEPKKVIGELISNSIDAKASKINLTLDERHLLIQVSDNGTGILDTDRFITIAGSGRKGERQNPDRNRNSSGDILEDTVIGIFGEGLKTVLSMCSDMVYESNNGKWDTYAHFRKLRMDNNKNKDYFDHVIKKYELNSQRKELGTTVTISKIDPAKFDKIKNQIGEYLGETHAWRIGSKSIQISVGITDKSGNKSTYIVGVPEKMAVFFVDYASQREIFSHNPRIEGIFVNGAVKPSDRKIYWCCNLVTMKVEHTEYNIQCIINSNDLTPNRDKTKYIRTDLSDLIEMKVEKYLHEHFKKVDWTQQLKLKDKRDYMTVVDKLNNMAMQRGLFPRNINPILPNLDKTDTVHLSDDQNLEDPDYVKTHSKNPKVKKVSIDTILWKKQRGKIVPPAPGTLEGGNPPGPGERRGGTNTLDPTIPEADLLVRQIRYVKGKEYSVLEVQKQKQDKKKENSFFKITMAHWEDDDRIAYPVVNAGGATIWLNTATSYCKLFGIEENGKLDIKTVLTFIAQCVESVFNPPNGKIPMSYEQHMQEVSKIINDLSKALTGDGGGNTERQQPAAVSGV